MASLQEHLWDGRDEDNALFPQQGLLGHILLEELECIYSLSCFINPEWKSLQWGRSVTTGQKRWKLSGGVTSKTACREINVHARKHAREMIQQLRTPQQHGEGCSSSSYDGEKAMELTGGGRTDQQRKGCTMEEIFLKLKGQGLVFTRI